MTNRGIPMEKGDDTAHFSSKLSKPLRIFVLLLQRSRWELRPAAVDKPDRARRVREIPAPQRGVEVWWMNRVDPDGVGTHVCQQRNPPLVRTVVRGKLRRMLPGKSGRPGYTAEHDW